MVQRSTLGHPVAQKIVIFVLRVAFKLLMRLEISGLDRIPRSGPLIIIINHIAFLDPIICASLPRLITPIAKKEAFDRPAFRLLMNGYGTISVARGEADIQAMRLALKVLKNEGAILLAPEGTRSPNYQLQPGKEGAVMLALRSGAPIVPVGVTGTHQLAASWKRMRRASVCLSVGKPFRLHASSLSGRASREEMVTITREMMYRLAQQLPPAYRGVYHNLAEATHTYLISAEI